MKIKIYNGANKRYIFLVVAQEWRGFEEAIRNFMVDEAVVDFLKFTSSLKGNITKGEGYE